MNLEQFRRINVLSLPVISVGNPPQTWPRVFFLHSHDHVIYVEKVGPLKVELYDSLGRSAPCFERALEPNEVTHHFGTRILQRSYRSQVCAIHAVLFSLGLYCTDPDYKIRAFVLPCLVRLKEEKLNGKWYTYPLPFSIHPIVPRTTHAAR